MSLRSPVGAKHLPQNLNEIALTEEHRLAMTYQSKRAQICTRFDSCVRALRACR